MSRVNEKLSFDFCQVAKVVSVEEASPEFALSGFVDVEEFVVPESLGEGDVVWRGNVEKHLLPGDVHFFCMLHSFRPEGEIVWVVFFFLCEEISNGVVTCIGIEWVEGG